jgi:UDP-N-acetylmuramoylalanine--D-glutamate ligase
MARAISEFSGVEHRLEFLTELKGVKYYNDSKATNVDATRKALEAFEGNVVLILGGKDKGSDYTVLSPLLKSRVKTVLLIGAAARKIEGQLKDVIEMRRCGTLQRAVEVAPSLTTPGDIVLLAPACASFDQFENYEHRGRVFKELVWGLKGRAAPV